MKHDENSDENSTDTKATSSAIKREVLAWAPAVSALITLVFVALTAYNISLTNSQRKIENAILIRDSLTPQIEFLDATRAYIPEANEAGIVGIQNKIRNASSSTVRWKADSSVSIFDCEGNSKSLIITTGSGNQEAIVKPSSPERDGPRSAKYLPAYSEDALSIFITDIHGYDKDQVGKMENEETLIIEYTITFFVDGVEEFREFISEHEEFFGAFRDDFNSEDKEPPIFLNWYMPAVYSFGNGAPRTMSNDHCDAGIRRIQSTSVRTQ